jgi:putative membrane protein
MFDPLRTGRATAVAALALAAFTGAACRASQERDVAADSVSNETGAATATATGLTGAQALTDAQIAHVVMTANSGEVDLGNLAKDKAENADVKAFANDMVTDHSAANEKGDQLAQQISLTPEENDLSTQLKSSVEQSKAKLDSAAAGAAFDKAYIDDQVTAHQTVLDALDNTLIPGAQNADLKSMLQNMRPTVAQHLERAKQLQTKLGQ